MLYRVAQSEKITPRLFQTVAQSDQLFPAIDSDKPVVFQIACEFLCILQPEIGDIAVSPDEGMKGLNIDGCAAIFFATINAHRAGLAEFDRDDVRRFVGAEKELVILKSHPANSSTSRKMTKISCSSFGGTTAVSSLKFRLKA